MTLADLQRALAAAVAELSDAEVADGIGACAAAQARLTARLVAPPPVGTIASDELVDAVKMAEILGTPANWVRDKARSGAIPSHQLGHYVRFCPRDVLEAVRQTPGLHDSRFRGVKKRTENRGGRRPVSMECPSSSAKTAPESRHG